MKEHPIIFSGPMVQAILAGRKTQTRRVFKPQPEFEGIRNYGESWKWRKGKDWFSGVTTDQLKARFCLLHPTRCRYQPSDRLWVRENVQLSEYGGLWSLMDHAEAKVEYSADGTTEFLLLVGEDKAKFKSGKRSSRFMPRWASRITLEVTGIRIERLQKITESAAKAEGLLMQRGDGGAPRDGFKWHGEGFHGGNIDKRLGATYHVAENFGKGKRCGCKVGGLSPAQCAFQELWNSLHKKPGTRWEQNPWVAVIEFQKV